MQYIVYSIFNLESLLMFHLTLVRTKLENASTVSNSVPSDKAKNLKRISAEVRRPLSKPFLTYDHASYRKCSKFLKFHTLHNRGVYFDLLFISFYSDFAAKHLCKDVDILSNTFIPSKKFCVIISLHFHINLPVCFRV